jgi:flagellar basal body-associated protein FliL
MLKSITMLLLAVCVLLLTYDNKKIKKDINENTEAIDDTLIMLLEKGE